MATHLFDRNYVFTGAKRASDIGRHYVETFAGLIVAKLQNGDPVQHDRRGARASYVKRRLLRKFRDPEVRPEVMGSDLVILSADFGLVDRV
jgi:hypothetical protein